MQKDRLSQSQPVVLKFLTHRWAGLLAAALYWMFETTIHTYVYSETFNEAFWPHSTNEFIMRVTIAILIIIFGGYVQFNSRRFKKTAEDMQRMLESTTDAYLEINYEGDITYINKRARNILNVKGKEIINSNVWDIFPEAVDDFYMQVQEVINTRESTEFLSFYSAIGRWLEVHAYPFEESVTFYFRDVTEQKLLLESNRRLNTILGSASDGIITINQSGIIETFNDAAEDIFGYKRDEVVGQNITILMEHEHDIQDHDHHIVHYMNTGASKIIDVGPREVMARRKDGSSFPMDLAVNEMSFGDQKYFIGIVRDITERRQVTEKLEHLSNYDALTDLPNRVLFSDRLSQAIKNAHRNKSIISLMFVDLDKFKKINDTLGHAAGDQLLINVAHKLRKCVRESDTVARLSGDEFAVLLCSGHKQNDVSRVAEKVLSELGKPTVISGQDIVVTASIGISQLPKDANTEEALLHCADTAMYKAKHSGRNAFVFYEAGMS